MGGHNEAWVNPLSVSDRRLKGRVIAIEKTGETVTREGEPWEKCIFTLEVTRFSKRTPSEVVPENLRGKKVKLVRHCLYDWHYGLGVEKTLSPEETESLLRGKPSSTVFW
jgi:hypothetical protein